MFLRKVGCFRWKPDLSLGLETFGREATDAMFDLGMLVDMTHCTPRAREEVFDVRGNRDNPLVMTHVGARADPKNPTPDEIRRIADTGGIVSVIFYTYWLTEHHGGDVLRHVVETVKHFRKHGGADCLAFGSDFDGLTDPPDDLKEPARLPRLTQALLDAEFTDHEVRGFLGGNFLRVFRDVWGS